MHMYICIFIIAAQGGKYSIINQIENSIPKSQKPLGLETTIVSFECRIQTILCFILFLF